MNAASGRKKRRLNAEMNVVPYIDVMLVLLVIFMVTAPLLSQGVKVDLPHSSASRPSSSPDPFMVTVDKAGRMYISHGSADPHTAVSADAVRNAAEHYLAEHPKQTVFVRADKDTPYHNVISAMALLQAAGAEKVGLPTQAVDVN